MTLVETLSRIFGRVEIALAGADPALREAEDALGRGEYLQARAQAHGVLRRVPGSPLALALLADACAGANLNAELAMTLEDLAVRVPARAEVWLRLGRARALTEAEPAEVRDAYLRGLAAVEAGNPERRELLLELADVDFASGDARRAELWLARLATDDSLEVAVRRGECALALGRVSEASDLLERFADEPVHVRALVALGRVRATLQQPSAYTPLLRAAVLGDVGALGELCTLIGTLPAPAELRERVRVVASSCGVVGEPRWRAAFARAEGRREEARDALRAAVAHGDRGALDSLLRAAVEDHDLPALQMALAETPTNTAFVRQAQQLYALLTRAPASGAAALAELTNARGQLADPACKRWLDAEQLARLQSLVPELPQQADWDAVLSRVAELARLSSDLVTLGAIEQLSLRRARPIKLAIVGEFNAGKSTFINALLGAEIAPTGILPTTATMHVLRYGQDAVAKIYLWPETTAGAPSSASAGAPIASTARGDAQPSDLLDHANLEDAQAWLSAPQSADLERIVPSAELRATLLICDVTRIARVELFAPHPELQRVEVLDTPGFNAPDPRHAESAREALREADMALWLLDATQAFKASEREVLQLARDSGLPVQLLLNKADRLKDGELERVLAQVAAAVEELGLGAANIPIAFSARLAVAGKLGDAAALEQSGWDKLEAFLDREVRGRASLLREASLRRRARQVAGHLGARLARSADAASDLARAARMEMDARVAAIARLEQDERQVAAELAASLQPVLATLQAELAVLGTGRDGDPKIAQEANLQNYRSERALQHICPSLLQFWQVAARPTQLPRERLSAAADSLVRGWTAGSLRPSELMPFARAAVACLRAELALPPSNPQGSGAADHVAELATLCEVLAQRAQTSASSNS